MALALIAIDVSMIPRHLQAYSALGGCLFLGGVCSWGVSAVGEMSAPGGVCSRGVSAWGRGCLLQMGCLLPEGVSVPVGVCLGGVCSRGCLLQGGVCSQGVSTPGGLSAPGGWCMLLGVSAPGEGVCSWERACLLLGDGGVCLGGVNILNILICKHITLPQTSFAGGNE